MQNFKSVIESSIIGADFNMSPPLFIDNGFYEFIENAFTENF